MDYRIVKNLLLKNPDILDDRIRINGVISDLYGEEKLISNIMMYLYDSNILKLIFKGNIIESDIKDFVKKVSNNYGIEYKRVIECFDEWFKIIDLKIAKEYLQKKSIKNYDNYILFNRLIKIKKIIIEENKDYSYILIKTVNVMAKLTILLMILFIIYGFRQILINTNGWVKILNNWYYFKNSSIVKNEIIIDNDNMYCFNNYGIMFRDSFIHYNNNYYYAGENGILYRNRWIKDGHRWKYASNDGKIIKNNWIEIDGDIYIFDGFCDLYTHRWIDFGEYQYWVDEEGKLQRNKWIDNHYVGDNGYMVKNTIVQNGNYVDKPRNGVENKQSIIVNDNITGSITKKWYDEHAGERIAIDAIFKVLSDSQNINQLINYNSKWDIKCYTYYDNDFYMVLCIIKLDNIQTTNYFVCRDSNGNIIYNRSLSNLNYEISDSEVDRQIKQLANTIKKETNLTSEIVMEELLNEKLISIDSNVATIIRTLQKE